MLVDGAVFFDEQVALRHIGFGLVVVVVADEILHRIFREKLAKLAIQLRRQRFVGCKDDGWPAQAGNDIGHGEGFARAGYAQQGLVNLAVFNAFDQLRNGRWLIARRRIGLKKLKG